MLQSTICAKTLQRRQVIRVIASIAIVFSIFPMGCDRASLVKRFTSPENESEARRYVDLLRQQHFEQIENDLDRDTKTPDVRETLAAMAAMIPPEQPASSKVVGVWKNWSNDYFSVSITLEYEFSDRWLLANIVTQKRGGVASLAGFHINAIPDSLENLNRFTLVGKNPTQFGILMLAIVSLAVSIYAFVLCIKTKRVKGKWLWLIVTLVGVGKLGVNWTTGQTFMTLLMVQAPPGGAGAPPYGAWIVFVSFPLGAVIFLLHGRTLPQNTSGKIEITEAQIKLPVSEPAVGPPDRL